MLSINIKNILSYSNSDDKVNFFFSEIINEVGEPPNHKRHLGFTVVCLWNIKIKNLKSAKIAQPALKLELDLYIP